jgi:hypothetical protein
MLSRIPAHSGIRARPPVTAGSGLVDWARHGPEAVRVTGLAVREERPEGLGTFVIR